MSEDNFYPPTPEPVQPPTPQPTQHSNAVLAVLGGIAAEINKSRQEVVNHRQLDPSVKIEALNQLLKVAIVTMEHYAKND